MTELLQNALENVYRTFSYVSAPKQFDVSPFREADAYLDMLHTPLRILDGKQLGPYAGRAITTVGSEQDYLYFLPRILELATIEPVWLGFEPPVIAQRIKLAGWERWPDERRDAVASVFTATFHCLLERPLDESGDPEDWLCGLATLDAQTDQALRLWRESASLSAMLHLAKWISREPPEPVRDILVDTFWDAVSEQRRTTVINWLSNQTTRQQLEAALVEASSDDGWIIERALRAFE